jgi:hypothetical protein
MGVFFESFSIERCCLCGSTENLTGEHKVKASVLRSIFGREPMMIGHFDGVNEPRLARGPKSREFHFASKLCGFCNSTGTQPADIEFSKFHDTAMERLSSGHSPGDVFSLERYKVGSPPYLNVFRYFAKLMTCHVSEAGGPRPLQVAAFANGRSDRNVIKLFMDPDPTYQEYAALTGEHSYAAHGGLIVKAHKDNGLPTGFHTYLTLGPLRYVFWVEFSPIVALELKFFHKDFFAKCRASYEEALRNPMTEDEMKKLGL